MHYRLTSPDAKRIPVILSIPHCGTAFPEELQAEYNHDLITAPDDTDWFVDRLYDFAPSLGITVLSAVWSRWVIDLNRHPESKPLYADGRIVTDLCPLTTFLGEPLYKDARRSILPEEIQRRKLAYFKPYHDKLAELLGDLHAAFGHVLLWDCHSIRQRVPTIRRERFPDLILGSADETSAHPKLISKALSCLTTGSYGVMHNDPFKGGYITRHYGQPRERIHALQLEMCKVLYMDDTETAYHPPRASRMADLLRDTLHGLSETLISLKDY